MINGDAVNVYNFYDAPKEWQQLSTNGGDEDYIIVATPHHAELAETIADKLAICDHSRYEWKGMIVFITCHA